MPRYLRNLIIGLIVIGVLYGLDFVFQAGIINPYYTRGESRTVVPASDSELDAVVAGLSSGQN